MPHTIPSSVVTRHEKAMNARKDVRKLAGRKTNPLQDLYDQLVDARKTKRSLNRGVLEDCQAVPEYEEKAEKVKSMRARLKEIFVSARKEAGIDEELDRLGSDIAGLEDNIAAMALRMMRAGETVEVEVLGRDGKPKKLVPRFKVGFNQGELF